MRALLASISLYLRTRLSWRTCRAMCNDPHYKVVSRDGLLYIEPREAAGKMPITCKGWLRPR